MFQWPNKKLDDTKSEQKLKELSNALLKYLYREKGIQWAIIDWLKPSIKEYKLTDTVPYMKKNYRLFP